MRPINSDKTFTRVKKFQRARARLLPKESSINTHTNGIKVTYSRHVARDISFRYPPRSSSPTLTRSYSTFFFTQSNPSSVPRKSLQRNYFRSEFLRVQDGSERGWYVYIVRFTALRFILVGIFSVFRFFFPLGIVSVYTRHEVRRCCVLRVCLLKTCVDRRCNFFWCIEP